MHDDDRDYRELLEPAEAIRAFEDYYEMGPGRSVSGLARVYRQRADEEGLEAVPTVSPSVLDRWSQNYHWRLRSAEREARIAAKTEESVIEDRAELKRVRIRHLIETEAFLFQQLSDTRIAYEEAETRLPLVDRMRFLPKLVTGMIQAMKEMRIELGEDTQRFHVTVEQVVAALPAEIREPVRDALYAELMAPEGH